MEFTKKELKHFKEVVKFAEYRDKAIERTKKQLGQNLAEVNNGEIFSYGI